MPLVVDGSAAGMTLNCQRCGKPTAVPSEKTLFGASAPGESSEKEAELLRHLKENESQRIEITGYINQLNIQLHRWQLRLQTLNERNTELEAGLTGLVATVDASLR